MHTYVDLQLSPTEIQRKYGISRTTAWRARNRGYFIQKNPPKIDQEFISSHAYKLAWAIYFRAFHYQYQKARTVQEDIIQEIVLALYLKSGYEKFFNGGWRWMVGLNAGRDFLYRERIIKRIKKEVPKC